MWIGLRKLGPYLLALVLLAVVALVADYYWPVSQPVAVSEEQPDSLAVQDSQKDTAATDTSAQEGKWKNGTAETAEGSETGTIAEQEVRQDTERTWTVVLGSFPSREKAEQWMLRHPLAEEITYAPEVGSYRVTGGFFLNLGEAQDYQESISGSHPKAWITKM